MGRPSKVNFNAEDVFRRFSQRCKQSEAKRYSSIAKLCGCETRTAKNWFDEGKITPQNLEKIESYISGEINITGKPKKEKVAKAESQQIALPIEEQNLSIEFGKQIFPRMSEEAFETPIFRDLEKWLYLCELHLSPYVIRGDSYTHSAYIRVCGGIDIQKELMKFREKYGNQISFETIINEF